MCLLANYVMKGVPALPQSAAATSDVSLFLHTRMCTISSTWSVLSENCQRCVQQMDDRGQLSRWWKDTKSLCCPDQWAVLPIHREIAVILLYRAPVAAYRSGYCGGRPPLARPTQGPDVSDKHPA